MGSNSWGLPLKALGFRVLDLRFRTQDLGFSVKGLGESNGDENGK